MLKRLHDLGAGDGLDRGEIAGGQGAAYERRRKRHRYEPEPQLDAARSRATGGENDDADRGEPDRHAAGHHARLPMPNESSSRNSPS
jgi:hypothetical protein